MEVNEKFKGEVGAILIPCVFAWLVTYLAVEIFREYAIGLFVILPFAIGFATTLLYGKNNVKSRQLIGASFFTLIIYCIGLLAFAWEGLICLIMAAPIGLLLTWTGFLCAHQLVKRKYSGSLPIIILFISVPIFMGFEYAVEETEEVRSVTTTIEINTTPERVWKNVLSFSKMEEPDEFIFKTGIAYPIDAQIDGYGVGAVRHCNFSTGSFFEPITVWDEPRLLKFDVDDQPEPLKELSLYDIHPNHLHGYWVSKEGQFKLTQLPNGNTLLEGTTWYSNRIKPDIYWTLWSDHIVHAIHLRVLKHIKEQSENFY
jgi:hypothetical protein